MKTPRYQLRLLVCLVCLSFVLPLAALAQTPANAPADANAAAAKTTLTGQAPDDVMKRLSDLVRAGKYAEAEQSVTALLILYPDDQRLIKAKALLDKALASPKPADPAASRNPPASNVASAQPAFNGNAEPFTGMDKVDYNALIELAREAQQNTDLEQQKASLKQFMDQSSLFLQKHPDQMLLWQLRAASAISLNDPMAGYEAGQKLLAMGAADRNDLNLQRLLAQLKNKGWLDEEWAEKIKKQLELTKKYGWMLGTWSETFTSTWKKDTGSRRYREIYNTGSTKYEHSEEFQLSKSSAVIEAYDVNAGVKSAEPRYRGTLVDSGEMHWEGLDVLNERHVGGHPGSEQWEQATSCEIDEHKRTMTLVFVSWNDQKDPNASRPEIHLFTKSDLMRVLGEDAPEPTTPAVHNSAVINNQVPHAGPVSEPVVQGSALTNAPTREPSEAAVHSSASLNVAVSSESPHSADTETAILHVYRLKHFYGSATSYGVYIDGKKIIPIRNAQTIRMLLAAGKHSISVSEKGAKTRKPINDFDMVAGKEYWVRVDLGVGFPMGYFIVSLVPDDQAGAESRQLEQIKMVDLSKN
ncbi:MAG: hypothetical protein LAN36_03740 [Acidobacteriia bacterium]|nr:hypothetical protein [Terriglobia bacterium]